MYDLIIIGGGPAGLTAAAYAIRKRLEVLLISEDLGGKANYRLSLKGMEGHEVITGDEILERFKNQVKYLDYMHHIASASKVEPLNHHYAVHTKAGKRFETRAVLLATGANPRYLDVPGARKLAGRGLSYSAISHATLFAQRATVLVGSSGAALRSAAELAHSASQLTIVAPSAGELDSPVGRRLREDPKVMILQGWNVQEVFGTDYVEGVVVRAEGGEERRIPAEGVFVELGLVPNSSIVSGLCKTNAQGAVLIDAQNQTSRPGIFAAGDVTNVPPEQHLIAIGEGAKACLSAYEYLLRENW